MFFFSPSVNSLLGYIISKVPLKSASDFGRRWVSPDFIGYPLAPFMFSEPGSYGDSPLAWVLAVLSEALLGFHGFGAQCCCGAFSVQQPWKTTEKGCLPLGLLRGR